MDTVARLYLKLGVSGLGNVPQLAQCRRLALLLLPRMGAAESQSGRIDRGGIEIWRAEDGNGYRSVRTKFESVRIDSSEVALKAAPVEELK
jgi:hypothetical protein